LLTGYVDARTCSGTFFELLIHLTQSLLDQYLNLSNETDVAWLNDLSQDFPGVNPLSPIADEAEP
jgi:hypothetical protein